MRAPEAYASRALRPSTAAKAESRAANSVRAQREGRGVLAGGGGEAGRAVLVLEEPLRAPGARIDRTLPPLAPAVVGRVGGREVEVRVIAIVGELVEHRRRRRETCATSQSSPCRASSRTSGMPLAPGSAVRLEPVAERPRVVAIRHQHHEGRVRRRRDVLEVVGGVGPSAAHGHELAGARRVDDDAVARVHRVAEHRVAAGALLAHVVQQRVGARRRTRARRCAPRATRASPATMR